jgi:hypothetical protein
MNRDATTSHTCPFCESETSVERRGEPELGALSLEEIETLVRNEWRGRSGTEGYARRHPRALVGALVLFALDPFDREREREVENQLWDEIAMLETWGLSREAKREELRNLAHSVWDVLTKTDLEFDASLTLVERMETKLWGTLQWP